MKWLYISKGIELSKISLYHLRIKMQWPTRAVSSTAIVVERLDAMKNMWESLGEPLERDSKNT